MGDITPLHGPWAASGPTAQFCAVDRIATFWDTARDGRVLPDRDALDLATLGAAQDHLFLVERIACGIGRIRLAGAYLSEVMGLAAEGVPFSALFRPADRRQSATLLEAVLDGPERIRAELTAGGHVLTPPMTGRLFLAPVADRRRGVLRLLGALQADAAPKDPPRRFRIDRIARLSLGQEPCGAVVHPGFAEPAPAAFAQAPCRTHGRPALRLVKNG